ncbi:transcriptional regulator with XRE-family HTH domain [Weissella uvarum]|uniref:helix-turn-helix domain-containing protein n=1 Tax=Weissella uvarum TaxID=1479233 RepID=UPI00195F410A|nr:helix-turn-helix transcriptional regulator [Weissella uvarum]MBM7616688.1 transcriptional regulator with XRE-family HTH domain [Weissella uvarum]MCM0594857.1 helix-turn-helix transcriptional regulator [Weissella uvarum]
MTLFERTKQIAKERGLTLRQLEKQAGLGDKSIYAWKRYTPRGTNLKNVADVLGVSVDYLLGETEDKGEINNNSETSQDFFKIDLSDIPEQERQRVIDQMEEVKEILTRDMK